MPRGRCGDREFFELEYQRLFTRVGQMACREDGVPPCAPPPRIADPFLFGTQD